MKKILIFYAGVIALVVLHACGTPPVTPQPPIADATTPITPLVLEAASATTFDAGVPKDAGSLGRPSAGRQRKGVNNAGAQFASDAIPGVYGVNYKYPDGASFAYFVARGFDHFRVGFLHERIQPKLQGPISDVELARLKAAVKEGTSRGARVAIVPHNSFRHGGQIVSEVQIGDLWGRLAQSFADDPLVEIDITNEPKDMTSEVVLALDNAAIREIRRVGFTGLVWAPGNGWTGAMHWTSSWYGTTNAKTMLGVKDPIDNVAYEVHLYLDADGSGAKECVSPTIGAERLDAWIAWLRDNGKRGVVGEIGGIDTPMCRLALTSALRAIERASDVVLSWDAWSAGVWAFATTYAMSLGPSSPDKPMLSVYREFGPFDVRDAGLDGSRVAP